jgi:ribosomal protein S18 acetylase RimI-like enzyme
MAAAVTLRPMTERDLPAATRLWSTAEGVELAEGDSTEELTCYLRRNAGGSFVALAGEQLVGAVLAGHDGRRGFLYHLAVATDRQGAGIGRALVGSSVAALKAAGIVRVLIFVARDNRRGRSFWTKQGWEPLDSAEPMGLNL